jgi:hypothetical protein
MEFHDNRGVLRGIFLDFGCVFSSFLSQHFRLLYTKCYIFMFVSNTLNKPENRVT